MASRTELLKRANRLNERLAKTKYVNVKIEGWGGKRNIPIKQIRNFVKDVKAIRGAYGWSTRDQIVQIDEKAVPKLGEVVKKHGLRMNSPKKRQYSISGFDV